MRFIHVGDDGHEVYEDVSPPGYRDGTNQEMELRSCIEALELLKRGKTKVPMERFKKILIHTDSQYVVNCFKTALYEWQVNGWRTFGGAPVVNAKLWNDLIRAVSRSGKQVEFTWVKGHKSSDHNKVADKLAKLSANSPLRDALHTGAVRRKESNRQVVPGSVELSGQLLTIRIISERYLPRQKCSQYRYEVMSKKSPFFGCVDFVYSDQLLRAGHTYRVRFNSDSRNSQIAKLFREVSVTRKSEDATHAKGPTGSDIV